MARSIEEDAIAYFSFDESPDTSKGKRALAEFLRDAAESLDDEAKREDSFKRAYAAHLNGGALEG